MYDWDPTQTSATIEVFPKGEYELAIGEPKPFFRLAGDDKHESFGVRYPLTVKAPSRYEDKRTVYSTYLQSDGGKSFAKQFLMAALGYNKTREDEKRFDADMQGKDWTFDHQSGHVGDAWRAATGQRVIGSLDIQANNRSGDDMQQFAGWRPIHSGPIAE